MQSQGKSFDVALVAVLTALAIALSLLDTFVSSLIPALPGFKIGLANIVSLLALATLGLPQALLISMVRALLTALLSGAVSMLPFSLFGGIFSVLLMWLCIKKISLVKASVVGALAHNFAQVCVAAALTSSPLVFVYLPPLLALGAVSGFFMGAVCNLVLAKLPDSFTKRVHIVDKTTLTEQQ